VAAQAVLSGSFVNEVVARVQHDVFDYLDAPVARIGAQNGISPSGEPGASVPARRRRHRGRRAGLL